MLIRLFFMMGNIQAMPGLSQVSSNSFGGFGGSVKSCHLYRLTENDLP
jgi:hypothetical protein